MKRCIPITTAVSMALLLAGPPGSLSAEQQGLHVASSPFINNSSLSGPGAIAPNDIWAVGSIAGAKGTTQTLAEHWNGTSWSIVSTPAGVNSIAGMTALGSGTVIGVGRGTNNGAVILSS